MKQNRQYFFSVEGETEKWYLQWLQKEINTSNKACLTVNFNIKVCKDPLGRAKEISAIRPCVLYHFFDYEGTQEPYTKQFHSTLEKIRDVHKLRKTISCKCGYSNLTFEVWIILHKSSVQQKTSRADYLPDINRIFNEHFQSLNEYKKEKNFKRCLSQLFLSDVIGAVKRSQLIMKQNSNIADALCQHAGYQYCQFNPATNVGEIVSHIFNEVGLL